MGAKTLVKLSTPMLDTTVKVTPVRVEGVRVFIIIEQDPTTLPLASLY